MKKNKVSIFLRENKGILNYSEYRRNKKALIESFNFYNSITGTSLPISHVDSWYKAFIRFIKAQPGETDVATEFFRANISLLKTRDNCSSAVILICVVKDDLLRVRKLIDHHRKLGVQHFVFVDNVSTDGTREYLEAQPDVDLIQVVDGYTTNRREAWINRAMAYYGFNRWYLVVDSDELLVYGNCEHKNIPQLINSLDANHITRLRAIMLDMYSKDSLFSADGETALDDCCYFDKDTYSEDNSNLCFVPVYGGPRSRLFRENPLLTKYPLFKLREGDIQGKSHFLFPYMENHTPCLGALLHYKFLASDYSKYRLIAKKGNYHNNSMQYKDYIDSFEADKNITAYFSNSLQYTSSKDLEGLSCIDSIEW